MAQPSVKGKVEESGRDDPFIENRPRRRIRLRRVDTNRGANQGAPPSSTLNVYPFPFLGMWQPARHGHHTVFPVGTARRVGAWRRTVGLGVPRQKLGG
jgi:hypothetical protein